MMITPPPPEDFLPIVVERCLGCSRRLWALAPLAWPVIVPLPARCCSCGAWLKVELSSKKEVEATEAATTTEERTTKAQETTEGTAKVGPEALFEGPIPSLAELEEEK